MRASHSVRIAIALVSAGVSLALFSILINASAGATVNGHVLVDGDPVSSAHVRIRSTDNLVLTGPDGSFSLGGLQEGVELEITAWADGYYIATTHATPPATGVVLSLRSYHTEDHPEYEWVDPTPGTSEGACGNCHPMIFPQWQNNAHGGAISNPRFFSLYNGTDVSGDTQVAPGYVGDFPGTAGTCANCHAPGAGIDGYLTSNMNNLRDNITAGIHCDYCHKVGGAWLDPATRDRSTPTRPGAQSAAYAAPACRRQHLLRPL